MSKTKNITINNINYEIVKDEYNTLIDLDLSERITDYFDDFDYIFGDFSYDKVRLKGYYDSKNKKAKSINDIKFLDDYIENYCSFGAKYFLLKKIK